MAIENIIFDVGNVLVRWDPFDVIASLFPDVEPSAFYQSMRPVWIDLNLGKLSEQEAIRRYQHIFGFSEEELTRLMHEFKVYQKPVPGSIEFLDKLKDFDVTLFAITDNVKEIMHYHEKHSIFPSYFADIITSAHVGVLKPDPRIYNYLLVKHDLDPAKSIFIDDAPQNVDGAIKVGMQAFQFIDFATCEAKVIHLLSSA